MAITYWLLPCIHSPGGGLLTTHTGAAMIDVDEEGDEFPLRRRIGTEFHMRTGPMIFFVYDMCLIVAVHCV